VLAAYCPFLVEEILSNWMNGKLGERCPACWCRYHVDVPLDVHTDKLWERLKRRWSTKLKPLIMPDKHLQTGEYLTKTYEQKYLVYNS